MLKISKLNKKYLFGKEILKDVNLTLERGNILGLLAPNSSGKTSLIKILLNLTKFNSGEILLDNEKINRINNKDISCLFDKNLLKKTWTVKKSLDFFELFFDNFDKKKSK